MNCKREGCSKLVKSKGLCSSHYYKALYPTHKDRPKRGYVSKESPEYKTALWNFVKQELGIK